MHSIVLIVVHGGASTLFFYHLSSKRKQYTVAYGGTWILIYQHCK